MEFLDLLALGFGAALTPENLFFCLLGALLGTFIGVLPGIGPTTTIAVLLPITFFLPPLGGIIMLAGIYYGAQYGGSTTAILVNLPGEASTVVTAIDGYMIGLWVRLLTIPYRLLYPAILLFCCVGVYSLNNRIFDVALAAGFGLIGYLFRKAKCEPGPLLLGFVLGPLLETNLRRALLISQGDASVFIERPISLTLLCATALLLLMMILPNIRKSREEAFKGEEA